jgi:hypothetical protein
MGTVLLVMAVLLLLATLTSADGPGYTLRWWTVDGGGATLAGEGYTLGGTAGQPDAGTLTREGYILCGGFWGGGTGPSGHTVYLPLVSRNHP